MNLESLVEKAESFIEDGHKRYAVVAAAVCSLVSFLADFFSPLNAQYITAALAIVCTLAAFPLARKHKMSSFKIPLFQYLFLGATVCGLSSAISNSYADDGGLLASNFDQVKAYQSMLGVMRDVQEDVAVIRQDTTEIKQALAGLDKETSDDPRKELAKRGVGWHPFDFLTAALSGDLEGARLFRQAGMKFIGDPTGQCFALRNLYLAYAGPAENRTAIWNEVLAAIGNGALNAECSDEMFLDEGNLAAYPGLKRETRLALAASGKHYVSLNQYARFPRVSLLMLAVWTNDAEMVELFLAHGADANIGMDVVITQPVAIPVTPLAEAKRLGLRGIADMLSKHGASEAART